MTINDLSEQEVLVLKAYSNAKRHGVTMTMAQVASVTHLTSHNVRKAAIELRALELLEGSRMLRITERGEQILMGEEVDRPVPEDPGLDSPEPSSTDPTPPAPSPPDPAPPTEDDILLPSTGTDAVHDFTQEEPPVAPDGGSSAPQEQEAASGETPVVQPQDVALRPAPPRTNRIVAPDERGRKLSQLLAEQLHVDARRVLDIMRCVIHTRPSDPPPSNEELFTVMSAVQRYKLDPWMKQLHAFRSQGRLVVLVGYDGWVEIANRQPGFKGVVYEYSDEDVTIGGVTSWRWIKATCHSEGRLPTEVFCFFEEWYVPSRKGQPGPWQKHPHHRHRQKAFTMAVREHFGISLYDEVDAAVLRSYDTANAVKTATDRKMAMLKEGISE